MLIAYEEFYKQTKVAGLKLQLPELQVKDQKAQKIKKQDQKKSWTDIDGVLYWENLPYYTKNC